MPRKIITISALEMGALQQSFGGGSSDGWRSMETAPRDGTWVELKCSYGVAPWYCIARWTDEEVMRCVNGPSVTFKKSKPSWIKSSGGGPFDERSLQWRPYSGEVADYKDPTGGMQDDPAYWRGAAARKYGLPLDHFEAMAARNAKRNGTITTASVDKTPLTWWKRLFWMKD